MSSPVPVKRDVSLLPLYVAIRTTLLANSTISGLIGTDVFRVGDVTNNDSSYLIVTGLTYVPKNTYTSTEGCAHMQLTAVSFGSPDDADVLSRAAAMSLIETPFAIPPVTVGGLTFPGFDLLDALQVPKPPDGTPLQSSKVVWEVRERYEFMLRSQA